MRIVTEGKCMFKRSLVICSKRRAATAKRYTRGTKKGLATSPRIPMHAERRIPCSCRLLLKSEPQCGSAAVTPRVPADVIRQRCSAASNDISVEAAPRSLERKQESHTCQHEGTVSVVRSGSF